MIYVIITVVCVVLALALGGLLWWGWCEMVKIDREIKDAMAAPFDEEAAQALREREAHETAERLKREQAGHESTGG
jgi:hypothetical protein